jgi:hypothetical protein
VRRRHAAEVIGEEAIILAGLAAPHYPSIDSAFWRLVNDEIKRRAAGAA